MSHIPNARHSPDNRLSTLGTRRSARASGHDPARDAIDSQTEELLGQGHHSEELMITPRGQVILNPDRIDENAFDRALAESPLLKPPV